MTWFSSCGCTLVREETVCPDLWPCFSHSMRGGGEIPELRASVNAPVENHGRGKLDAVSQWQL